jgi:hypothetical protein
VAVRDHIETQVAVHILAHPGRSDPPGTPSTACLRGELHARNSLPSPAERGPGAIARVRARRNRRSSPTSVVELPRNIPPRCRGGMFALAANSLPASSPPPCRTPVVSSAARTHCFSSNPALRFPSPVSGGAPALRDFAYDLSHHPCGRRRILEHEANRCETATLASEGFPRETRSLFRGKTPRTV